MKIFNLSQKQKKIANIIIIFGIWLVCTTVFYRTFEMIRHVDEAAIVYVKNNTQKE